MAEQDGPRSDAERAEQPEESTAGPRGTVRPEGTQPDGPVPEAGPVEPVAPDPAHPEPALADAVEPGAADTVREPLATDAAQETALPDGSRSGTEAGARAAAETAAAETAADHEDGRDAPAAQRPTAQQPPAQHPAAQQPSQPPGEPGFDEEAAWAAIVAGYGEEPPDPPGAKPFKPIEDLLLPEPDPAQDGTGDTNRRTRPEEPKDGNDGKDRKDGDGRDGAQTAKDDRGGKSGDAEDGDKHSGPGRPLGGSVAFAPGVGPRDYRPADPTDDDLDEDDEGHFVPPEPPPLPSADATVKFGWLGVLGGPLLLLLSVLLGWEMTWWLATLGIGGFVGGFLTLVVRMNPGDGDDDDPGRGAVV